MLLVGAPVFLKKKLMLKVVVLLVKLRMGCFFDAAEPLTPQKVRNILGKEFARSSISAFALAA